MPMPARATVRNAITFFILGACAPEHPVLPNRAPLHAGSKITPADLSGCYDVGLGPWNPPVDATKAPLYSPPPRVQLTIESFPLPRPRFPGDPDSYRMLDRNPRSAFTIQAWSVTGPSSAALTWRTGKLGLTARLQLDRRSRGLNGSANTINGPAPSGHSAAIHLTRVPC
jgi:hypothetical protein